MICNHLITSEINIPTLQKKAALLCVTPIAPTRYKSRLNQPAFFSSSHPHRYPPAPASTGFTSSPPPPPCTSAPPCAPAATHLHPALPSSALQGPCPCKCVAAIPHQRPPAASAPSVRHNSGGNVSLVGWEGVGRHNSGGIVSFAGREAGVLWGALGVGDVGVICKALEQSGL